MSIETKILIIQIFTLVICTLGATAWVYLALPEAVTRKGERIKLIYSFSTGAICVTLIVMFFSVFIP
jgi:uncharacterized membrane protein YoaK (UPF0700 family)